MKKDVLISDYCEPGSVRMQMQMQIKTHKTNIYITDSWVFLEEANSTTFWLRFTGADESYVPK